MKNIQLSALLLSFGLLLLSGHARAMEDQDRAQQFAQLFLGFKLSALNAQPLINDPSKGDKGLTGPVMIEKTKENYKKVTGKDFEFSSDPLLMKAQKSLFVAIGNVMNKVAPVINRKGLGFKGMITAIFARKLAKEFTQVMGGDMTFKFTAPHNLLRSKANKADEWEQDVFTNKFKPRLEDSTGNYYVTQGDKFRWMQPLYHEGVCMNCHGGPKGERDITGSIKEGAKIGDLSGAFSITIRK